MSYSQVRLNKTQEIQETINFLKGKLKLLNDSEIIKLALSKLYNEYKDAPVEKTTYTYSPEDVMQQASYVFDVHSSFDKDDNNIANPEKVTPITRKDLEQ